MNCPTCNKTVVMAAIENPRNGRWTALPLDEAVGISLGQFELLDTVHEAVDILGQPLGHFPVAVYHGEPDSHHAYSAHPPSHYLVDPGHEHE